MSDLSNGLKIPDESVADEERRTKPAVMLITMILLIAALVLTGTMLLYYNSSQKQELAETNEGNEAPSAITSFFKSITSNSSDSVENEENAGGFSLFGNNDGSVRWPKLKLTGYGTRPDGSGGFAIINGHQYQEGQTVNGKVNIVEVREHDVLVEYAGETNSLIVDASN